MPTFADYETVGEPLATSDERGHVSTIWQARKSGAAENRLYAVKCYAPRRRGTSQGASENTLDRDRGLEFLEGVKQIKKAHNGGVRWLAPIHDLGIAPEGAWYATDFYPRTLQTYINGRGRVDSGALRHVVSSVVSGCLAMKRSRGYSHGNLKTSNVFLVGKPRLLRSTPLHLADAYPAAPLQLARLGDGDRAALHELLHEVMEARDLRAIGEMIFQLVEGRLVSSENVDYPVGRSPAWDRLGKDGEFWRERCNRLLDPHLTLEKVSLDSLAREVTPAVAPEKLLRGLVAVGAICLVGGGVYWAVSLAAKTKEARFKQHFQTAQSAFAATNLLVARQEIDEALKYKSKDTAATDLRTKIEQSIETNYAGIIQAGREALARKDYDTTLAKADEALKIKPGDREAGQLKSEAEGQRKAMMTTQEQKQKYEAALKAGREAFERKDYALAVAQANEALKIKPGDREAGQLKSEAEGQRKAMMTAQEQKQKYEAALKAGREAFERKDYALAVTQADEALKIRPGDETAKRLKSEAEGQRKAMMTAQEQKQKYEAALKAGREAFERKDYALAVTQADEALKIRPGDKEAGQLKSEAGGQRKAMMAAQEQKQKYEAALKAGREAFERKDYALAVTQADEALKIRPGDKEAGQLKSEAEGQRKAMMAAQEQKKQYEAALKAGQEALERKDYALAVAQANEALKIKPGGKEAGQLKSDAEGQRKAMMAAQEQKQQYEAALKAGQEALERKDYALAVAQANEALKIKPGGKEAERLKSDAEGQHKAMMAAQEQKKNYEAALKAGREALERKDYALAVAQANEALKIKPDGTEAKQLIQKANQELDLQQARTHLNSGEYAEASLLCNKHPGASGFDKLLDEIRTETNALQAATQKHNNCDYSFINDVEGQDYRGKPPFATLLQNGTKEQTTLKGLQARRDTNNWAGVLTILADSASAEFANKSRFRDHFNWAEGKKREVEEQLTKQRDALDRILQALLMTFKVTRPSWLNFPNVKGATLSGNLGIPEREHYNNQVGDLETEVPQFETPERQRTTTASYRIKKKDQNLSVSAGAARLCQSPKTGLTRGPFLPE